MEHVSACRVCGVTALLPVLDLGHMPLANAFRTPQDRSTDESRYPLLLLRCTQCGLLQLSIVVAPDLMFRDYVYESSASSPMRAHFEEYASTVVRRFTTPGALVVEVGSNDGLLLGNFARHGVRALGVEPARNLVHQANLTGLRTMNDFFGAAVARRIVAADGRAAVVAANNVLAHIADLGDVIEGLDLLLADDGVLVAEVPYALDMIERVEYDTIYHEHLSYFAIGPLAHLFGRIEAEIFDVERVSTHGGSIRIYVGRAGRHAVTARPAEMRALEDLAATSDEATYRAFAMNVERSRRTLRAMVADIRRRGERVAAFGASAKGTTLLNYCGLGPADIAYVADSSPLKQGALTPGTHIPVVPEDTIGRDRPDYMLLLAWNYAEAIVARHADYVAAGGKFIHPIPFARVVT